MGLVVLLQERRIVGVDNQNSQRSPQGDCRSRMYSSMRSAAIRHALCAFRLNVPGAAFRGSSSPEPLDFRRMMPDARELLSMCELRLVDPATPIDLPAERES